MSRLSRWLMAAVLLLPMLSSPRTVLAQDVITPKVLVRRFPQGVFCALPVSISFTAPAEPVAITFTALEWAQDGLDLVWTQQRIDNVTVATTAQVSPNFAGPLPGSSLEFCYIGDAQPASFFHFNRPGLTLDLLERFDTSPFARGWTAAEGAYFAPSSALRNVETETDGSGGSLGLGDGTGTPSASATASSSITLDHLQAGASYTLDAWWNAGFVLSSQDVPYLTISITTVGGTPVARRSWGALKSEYR